MSNINAQVKRKRRGIYPKLSKDQQIRCILGDAAGRITVKGTQYVWVRENIGTNSDGTTRYGAGFQVLPASGIAIPLVIGQPVLVGLSIGGELQIRENDVETIIVRGGKPRLLNPFDPYNKFVYMRNADIALVYPSGTGSADSLKLYLKPIIYIDDDGNTQAIADKTEIDMTSHVPSTANKKVLAAVFLDTVNNVVDVQISSEIATDESFDIDDLDEAVQVAPVRAMLLNAWGLYEGMTNIREQDFVVDGRQWINVPKRKNNYAATIAPTVNDDIDLGYEVGSHWHNITDNNIYVCVDQTDGAAIWQLVNYGFPNPITVNETIHIVSTHQVFLPELTVEGNLTVDGDLIIESDLGVIQKDKITATDLTVNDKARLDTIVLENSIISTISAAGGITPTRTNFPIVSDGGTVNITANPQIADGVDGQLLILWGTSDTDKVTVEDGNGVHLLGGSTTMGDHEVLGLMYHSDMDHWMELFRNNPATEKTWSFGSPVGSLGTFYTGGFYIFSGANNDFDPAINWGAANNSYGAHFFIVSGAVAVDEITITITGTSITDGGVRDATPDTEEIVIPDTTVANTYYETSKKWIGQIAVETTGGTAKDCNYGWCKYWDNNNSKFKLVGSEALFVGGANDNGANILIRHHKTTGWTYNAGADPTPPTAIADMQTDYDTEFQIDDGVEGAWKRDNLTTVIDGAGSEGIIIERITTANKTFEPGLCSMMVRIETR